MGYRQKITATVFSSNLKNNARVFSFIRCPVKYSHIYTKHLNALTHINTLFFHLIFLCFLCISFPLFCLFASTFVFLFFFFFFSFRFSLFFVIYFANVFVCVCRSVSFIIAFWTISLSLFFVIYSRWPRVGGEWVIKSLIRGHQKRKQLFHLCLLYKRERERERNEFCKTKREWSRLKKRIGRAAVHKPHDMDWCDVGRIMIRTKPVVGVSEKMCAKHSNGSRNRDGSYKKW